MRIIKISDLSITIVYKLEGIGHTVIIPFNERHYYSLYIRIHNIICILISLYKNNMDKD